MTSGFVETIIHWETTPDELRRIADKMENQQKNAKPGTTTCVRIVSISDPEDSPYIALHIHYKQ